jgi:hypothetical protein
VGVFPNFEISNLKFQICDSSLAALFEFTFFSMGLFRIQGNDPASHEDHSRNSSKSPKRHSFRTEQNMETPRNWRKPLPQTSQLRKQQAQKTFLLAIARES